MNQIGGSGWTIDVEGAYAYLGEGLRLTVIDISQPDRPDVIGSLLMTNDIIDLKAVGNTVYVTNPEGLHIINVANPGAPIQVGTYKTANIVYSVDVAGPYAYIGEFGGLRVIDVSNPALPIKVGEVPIAGWPLEIVVTHEVAYVVDGTNGLHIIDITNEADPFEVGFQQVDNATDVFVTNGYAYVVGVYGYLHVYDIDDLTKPLLVGSLELGSGSDSIVVDGNDAFVVGSPYLTVVNVANPNSLGIRSVLNIPGSMGRDVVIMGQKAFVASYDGGMRIVDITIPIFPTEIGSYITPGLVRKMVVSDGYAYTMKGYSGGLFTINITDPTHISLVGTPVPVRGVYELSLRDNFIWAASDEGLLALDITNREQPVMASVYDTGAVAYAVHVMDGIAYVGTFRGLSIVDVSNPYAPVGLGFLELPGEYFYYDIDAKDGFVFMTWNKWADGYTYGMHMIDARNPRSPAKVGILEPTGSDSEMEIVGDYLYYTGSNGLRITNIASPMTPVEVGFFPLGSCRLASLAKDRNHVHVGTAVGCGYEDNVIYSVNINNPSAPVLTASYPLTYTAILDVASSGEYLYAAGYFSGLLVIYKEE